MTIMVQILLWLSVITIGVQTQSLKEEDVVVTTILETPYIMLRDSPLSNLTGNDRYEGYIVDLVDEIAKMLHFKYVLKVNHAGSYGSVNKDGKWNGLIGDLLDRRAHIAAGAMTITAERENAVDFTIPFMTLGIGALFKREIYKRGPLDDFIDLFYPFKYNPTDVFFLLTLLFGIILFILRRKYKTIIFKILLGFWLLFLFIFASIYIAQLSSYYSMTILTIQKVEDFGTIEELAKANTVTYGCIKGGSTESFFRNSKNNLYSQMWSHMSSSDPTVFVSNSVEGLERVLKGQYAFMTESTVIEYVTARNCDLYQIGGLLDMKGYGLAVQKGSSIREQLSQAILKLQEQGILAELKNKWWLVKRGGEACN